MSGTVIMVHVANMPSFLGRTVYFSPVDGKNLNRVYPGRIDGTVSERIAYAITTEVIEKADYLLDLHCGDGNESLRPYVYQTVTGHAKIDDAMARLVLAFGIDHILVDRNRPTDPAHSVYCSTTAITRGKPAVTIESGYLGNTDEESVERIVAGVFGVMRELAMTAGGPPPVERPVYLDPVEVVVEPRHRNPVSARGSRSERGKRRAARPHHRFLRRDHRRCAIASEWRGVVRGGHSAHHQGPAGGLRGPPFRQLSSVTSRG